MREIQIDVHFHWCLILMLKNPGFFSCRIKTPIFLGSSWNYNTNILYIHIIVPWFHWSILKSNWTAISRRCEPQLRPNNFFFSTPLTDIVSFVYIFVVICQFFPNNSVRVYPIKLKIDMLYYMKNTFWDTVF